MKRKAQFAGMPQHDPIPPRRPAPSHIDRRAAARRRFKNLMGWMAVVAVVAVLLSLIYLKSFGDPVPIHMQIATALGVFFTVMVGTGLMSLVFLSSRSGHDDDATYRSGKHDGD